MDPSTFPDGNDPNNPVRIFMDGVFDGFHYGHARLLEQGKKKFKYVYLIAGVCKDEDTHKHKGKTLNTDYERKETLKHCKWVDEVIDCPWLVTLDFLNEIKAHYVARDPLPYRYGDIPDLYQPIKDAGRFLPTERTEGISTTDIILRIVRDVDFYIKRNIKKGCTAEELNISKEKYDEFKRIIEEEEKQGNNNN